MMWSPCRFISHKRYGVETARCHDGGGRPVQRRLGVTWSMTQFKCDLCPQQIRLSLVMGFEATCKLYVTNLQSNY